VIWSNGNRRKPVTDLTRFPAGSVSKPSRPWRDASGEQGKLTLDDDFNQFLTSWKIPHNTFTAKKVSRCAKSLRTRWLHRPWIRGIRPTAPRPGLIEVLNGVSPANSPPIIVNQAPGAAYVIPAADFASCAGDAGVTDRISRPHEPPRPVPLEMKNSTYDLILPGDWQSLAAIGHSHGQPIPEMARLS